MKRLSLIFAVAIMVAASTTACSGGKPKGVVINGVEWATCNVDAPGTFVANPEDKGMLYQWNRIKAWSATDPDQEGWDRERPSGDTWEKENSPCPKGWRIPTSQELRSLLDTAAVKTEWLTINGVRGRQFADTLGNSIFLPGFGNRSNSGSLGGGPSEYWSSTSKDERDAWSLMVRDGEYTRMSMPYKTFGYSIRCVAE
jgi:uncharacterized protein (TIGR02145 family)